MTDLALLLQAVTSLAPCRSSCPFDPQGGPARGVIRADRQDRAEPGDGVLTPYHGTVVSLQRNMSCGRST